MSDTISRRRSGRDRSDERQILLSLPRIIAERLQLYNFEHAPHLSQNALIVEAVIAYLDAKGARVPEAVEAQDMPQRRP